MKEGSPKTIDLKSSDYEILSVDKPEFKPIGDANSFEELYVSIEDGPDIFDSKGRIFLKKELLDIIEAAKIAVMKQAKIAVMKHLTKDFPKHKEPLREFIADSPEVLKVTRSNGLRNKVIELLMKEMISQENQPQVIRSQESGADKNDQDIIEQNFMKFNDDLGRSKSSATIGKIAEFEFEGKNYYPVIAHGLVDNVTGEIVDFKDEYRSNNFDRILLHGDDATRNKYSIINFYVIEPVGGRMRIIDIQSPSLPKRCMNNIRQAVKQFNDNDALKKPIDVRNLDQLEIEHK